MIPPFSEVGELPPGIHPVRWDQLEERYSWNPWRKELLAGLQQGLAALAFAGCKVAYVDGSFISDKEIPGDFDACWEVDGVITARLDPVLLTFTNRRAAQKAKYLGEFFPAEAAATPEGMQYLEFFQRSKRAEGKKGIIQLDLRGWAQ